MVRERRRPTGTMEQQRKRHLQRQARQDALNRLHAGETVKIMALTYEGYRPFTVRPIDAGEDLEGLTVIVHREHKIIATRYCTKDGKDIYVRFDRHVFSGKGKIFGIVVDDVPVDVTQAR